MYTSSPDNINFKTDIKNDQILLWNFQTTINYKRNISFILISLNLYYEFNFTN